MHDPHGHLEWGCPGQPCGCGAVMSCAAYCRPRAVKAEDWGEDILSARCPGPSSCIYFQYQLAFTSSEPRAQSTSGRGEGRHCRAAGAVSTLLASPPRLYLGAAGHSLVPSRPASSLLVNKLPGCDLLASSVVLRVSPAGLAQFPFPAGMSAVWETGQGQGCHMPLNKL